MHKDTFVCQAEDGTCYYIALDKYTSDLNAIVAVVGEWLNTPTSLHAEWGKLRWFQVFDHEHPALALCIAFAKAAGLDWEGK